MFKHIKSDLPSSIVVYFVALPLFLGIALAIGVPLFSGLIAGFIGGILVGSFSGSTLEVSVPATVISQTQVWIIAFTLGLVASLETFLSVETDKLDPQKRVTPTHRELRAQGTGNIVSGLIGGLPITQVIVGSFANVQSSKLSAIFHGFLIIISVILFPKLLNMIPLSVLVVVLLLVGFKFAILSFFKRMFTLVWKQYIPIMIEIENLKPNFLLGFNIRKTRNLDNGVVEILQDFYEKARNININITIISGRSNVHNPQDYNEFFKLDIKRISA